MTAVAFPNVFVVTNGEEHPSLRLEERIPEEVRRVQTCGQTKSFTKEKAVVSITGSEGHFEKVEAMPASRRAGTCGPTLWSYN